MDQHCYSIEQMALNWVFEVMSVRIYICSKLVYVVVAF